MESKKKTVLIVDDSILIMERMIGILEEMEQISLIVHAENYREGVQMLDSLKPDLVLLDINLPDGNGIELLKIIRAQQSDITVLMITNQAEPYYMELCHRLGAHSFIDKSEGIESIPAVLAMAC